MVAVVSEIVRTSSPAENAINVLATIPNFDLFMDLSLPLWWFAGWRTAVENVVSSSRRTAYIVVLGLEFPSGAMPMGCEVDWELVSDYCLRQRGWSNASISRATINAFARHDPARFIPRRGRLVTAKFLLTGGDILKVDTISQMAL